MRVIVDPLIFWVPDDADEEDIKYALDFVDRTIHIARNGHSLISSEPLWKRIVQINYRKLSKLAPSHILQAAMKELQGHLRMVQWQVQNTETEGIRDLINYAKYPDAEEWMTALAQVVAYCVQTEDDYCLLTRLIEGRNLLACRSMKHCCIYEKSHWEVFVSFDAGNGVGAYNVPCIGALRNILVPWTRRYDDGLPDTAPGNGLAFIPKVTWRNRNERLYRAVNSKLCWIDDAGHAWSDTDTPGDAYHWDVFPAKKSAADAKFGDHVNITRYGVKDPNRERAPGEVHH